MRISDWSSDVGSSDLDREFLADRAVLDVDDAHRLLCLGARRADADAAHRRIAAGAGLVAEKPADEFAVLEVERHRIETRELHRTGAAFDIGAAILRSAGNARERGFGLVARGAEREEADRKSTRLNSSH